MFSVRYGNGKIEIISSSTRIAFLFVWKVQFRKTHTLPNTKWHFQLGGYLKVLYQLLRAGLPFLSPENRTNTLFPTTIKFKFWSLFFSIFFYQGKSTTCCPWRGPQATGLGTNRAESCHSERGREREEREEQRECSMQQLLQVTNKETKQCFP